MTLGSSRPVPDPTRDSTCFKVDRVGGGLAGRLIGTVLELVSVIGVDASGTDCFGVGTFVGISTTIDFTKAAQYTDPVGTLK